MSEEIQVSYTVADLLDRIGTRVDAGFARVETAMETKADKADMVNIATRLDKHEARFEKHEERLEKLEGSADALDVVREQRRRLMSAGNALLVLFLTVGLVLGTLGIHV